MSERTDAGSQPPEFLRAVIDHTDEIVAVVDVEGRVKYVNAAAERVLGYDPAELVGRVGFDFVHPDDIAPLAEDFVATMSSAGATERRDVRARDANGVWRWVELVLTNLLDQPSVRGVLIVCRDVTRRRRVQELLTHQALHDPLTGLPNRHLLLDRLTQSLARAERDEHAVAVLFLDVDGFKAVNDTYGHEAGDELLTQLSARLRRVLRRSDTVARYGGDELVVVAELHPNGVPVLLQRIGGAWAEPFELAAAAVQVTVSGGLVVAEARAEPHALLREADAAMYRAKLDGGGRFVVEPAETASR